MARIEFFHHAFQGLLINGFKGYVVEPNSKGMRARSIGSNLLQGKLMVHVSTGQKREMATHPFRNVEPKQAGVEIY